MLSPRKTKSYTALSRSAVSLIFPVLFFPYRFSGFIYNRDAGDMRDPKPSHKGIYGFSLYRAIAKENLNRSQPPSPVGQEGFLK